MIKKPRRLPSFQKRHEVEEENMKIICIDPPRFVKYFLRLFRRNRKKPAVSDGHNVSDK